MYGLIHQLPILFRDSIDVIVNNEGEQSFFDIAIRLSIPWSLCNGIGFRHTEKYHHNISRYRACVQAILDLLTPNCGAGVILYHEHISIQESLGYTLALLGFVSYNAAKMGYLESSTSSPWINLCCYCKLSTDSFVSSFLSPLRSKLKGKTDSFHISEKEELLTKLERA